MIFYNTHQKIDTLKSIVPDSFVFVLDSTDRSFLYKSKDSDICVDLIFGIDETLGLDKLTKKSSYHSHEQGNSILKVQRTSSNTFLGVCLSKGDCSARQVKDLDAYFKRTELVN